MISNDWAVIVPPIVFQKLANGEINRRQFVLWCVIAYHDRSWVDGSGRGCIASNATLAAEAGYEESSVYQVSRDITALVNAGLILRYGANKDRTLRLSANVIAQMRKGTLRDSATEEKETRKKQREGKYMPRPKTVFHLVEGKKDDDDWFKDIAHLFR